MRFVATFAATFLLLLGSWEVVLRQRSGATVDFAIKRPTLAEPALKEGEQWVVFGNCLVMTGLSPRTLDEELGEDKSRMVVNIAGHEQSPIAFFDYLDRAHRYPDVVVANVSSWINGTNFDQEGALVAQMDPLDLGTREKGERASESGVGHEQAYRKDTDLGAGHFQRSAEESLARAAGEQVKAFGHRYHLFDYSLFVGTLATTASLDSALYQLNMQSWFTVRGSKTDGRGFVGIDVAYRDDWSVGLERMAERSLQRLRVSRLLTARYWSLLEAHIQAFRAKGTQVVLVRMPEHPKIRAFNDATYEIPSRLRTIEERTGAPVLDLSDLGPAEGVNLFDAVHPDAAAADVISRKVGVWLRSRHVARDGQNGADRAGGG